MYLNKGRAGFPWRVAAPSCVWPDTAAANCRRLSGTVPEVGLYLLEAGPCLDYGPDDLPGSRDGLAFHAHLPLDLPWADGPAAAFAVADALAAKIAPLAPWGFVLHPPAQSADLAAFVEAWHASGRDPRDLLLENTETAGAKTLLPALPLGVSLCLDLGHLLAYGQADLLDDPAAAARTRMLHVYAPYGQDGPPPGGGHVHRSLACLRPSDRAALERLLGACAPEAVVLEVFSPAALAESLAELAETAQTNGARP